MKIIIAIASFLLIISMILIAVSSDSGIIMAGCQDFGIVLGLLVNILLLVSLNIYYFK